MSSAACLFSLKLDGDGRKAFDRQQLKSLGNISLSMVIDTISGYWDQCGISVVSRSSIVA